MLSPDVYVDIPIWSPNTVGDHIKTLHPCHHRDCILSDHEQAKNQENPSTLFIWIPH